MTNNVFMNRSKDADNEVLWVARKFDPETSRSEQLYLGGDVNGAIEAAIKNGVGRDEAVKEAQAILARANKSKIVDTIEV
jgi:hypothetical protein